MFMDKSKNCPIFCEVDAFFLRDMLAVHEQEKVSNPEGDSESDLREQLDRVFDRWNEIRGRVGRLSCVATGVRQLCCQLEAYGATDNTDLLIKIVSDQQTEETPE